MEKIIQITSGRGPLECMYAVDKIKSIFVKEAKKNGFTILILHTEKGPQKHTTLSETMKISGLGLSGFLKEWQGTLLWKSPSPFRKKHKRKNWFIELKVYQSDKMIDFDPRDIMFKTTRSSGPGGQHVNKTDTAVWAIHKETGIKILVQDTRSQLQNRKIAVSRLEKIFEQKKNDKMKKEEYELWKNSIDIKRGDPVKVF